MQSQPLVESQLRIEMGVCSMNSAREKHLIFPICYLSLIGLLFSGVPALGLLLQFPISSSFLIAHQPVHGDLIAKKDKPGPRPNPDSKPCNPDDVSCEGLSS
jgi:hypothetical protein